MIVEYVESRAPHLRDGLSRIARGAERTGEASYHIEVSAEQACPFLSDRGECEINSVKPAQCASFPFWAEHVGSRGGWAEAKERCEGIDHPDAELVPPSRILEFMKMSGTAED